ncbi:hypothetical protein ACFSL6_12595 [Paenibacillus thailandensis]|uniref:YmcC n=1 Tax=Paenibacillus thailandensis TaxID=393250 RepID=A0ABW5R072_9BACL
MIIALIVTCEIAFWLFIAAGLVCRYWLGWKRIGAVLLFSTIIIDLLLITATVIDLRGGAEAGIGHGLAAVYVGVSIAFGHSMIGWADKQFRYRFANGPAPPQIAKHGREHARRERAGWLRHALAWAIGCGLLYGMTVLIGDGERTKALLQMIRLWSIVLAIDFMISFSYTVWPRQEKKERGM